jgi:hypothetical protein
MFRSGDFWLGFCGEVYLMFYIGKQALSQTLISIAFSNLPTSLLDWKIQLYHKSGGLKKQWFWGGENSPFKSIEFELNKKFMGAGSFELNYLDFPIHAGDYIEIYFQNSLKYKALVDSAIDPKGGQVKLVPYSQQFQELLINDTFVSKTIEEIFETVINEIDSDTGIIWHDFYVDTNNTDTYTINYAKYEKPKKVFDDLIKECDDRDWGVNQFNIFSVYSLDSTISQNLLNTDTPYFTDIEEDKDYSKIKATRFQVEAKTNGVSEVTRIGQVGYGSGYAALTDVESKIRKKVEKFQVPEVITNSSEALDIAYANLVYNSQINNSVTIKGLNPNLYFPVIGKKIKAESPTEKVMKIIIDCDTIQGWSGAPSVSTTYYTEGDGSISFSGSGSPTGIVYDFAEYKRFFNPEKIGFMIRSNYAGEFLEFSTARYKNGADSKSICSAGICSRGNNSSTDYVWETSKTIRIPTGSVWFYMDYDLTDTDFRYLGFRFNSTPPQTPATVWIDEIQLFTYYRNVYEGNIVSAKFKFNSNGIKCDVELNDYKKFANDATFFYENKIKKLEAISNGDV